MSPRPSAEPALDPLRELPPRGPGDPPWVVGFLLLPEFILLSYAAAVETLRAANQLAQRPLYAWRNLTLDGEAVQSLTRAEIQADGKVGDDLKLDLLVIASTTRMVDSEPLLAWLRRLSRQGVRMAGIAGGVYLMARAGLLQGRRCAVHWAHAPGLLEEFPDLLIQPDLYVIDGPRITCAGSGASADLFHAIIEAHHGRRFAFDVNEWLTHGLRPQDAPQRRPIGEKLAARRPSLARAVEAMEAKLEDPLSREGLAAAAGLSVRQLERLFRRQFHSTIADHYRNLRLDHARQLLRFTSRPIGQIALASGFSSLSYFSRAFRARFDRSPSDERADSGREGVIGGK
ncbi:MAG: GlxA family transcriptional regulator [Caulobacteraceae bacterium]